MADTGDRWLTYEELGTCIDRTPHAARMFATRRGWPRRSANRIGEHTTVLVPADIADGVPRSAHNAARTNGIASANGVAERAIEQTAIAALTEQLAIANRRLDEEQASSARAMERAALEIDDFRRRLDESERERREQGARIVALLTDQRSTAPPASPRRSWWPWSRRTCGVSATPRQR